MNKRILVILLALLVLAGIMVSCKNEIQAPAEELVSVSFDNDSSRSLSSNLEGFAPETYYWKYAARKADSSNLISGQTAGYATDAAAREAGARWIKEGQPGFGTGSGDNYEAFKVQGFSQGMWDFTLYGYKWNDANSNDQIDAGETVLVYSGETTNHLLKAGNNDTHSVSVVVSPAQTGTGTLVVKTTGTAAEGRITLTPITANQTPPDAEIWLTVEKIVSSSATSIFNGQVDSTADYSDGTLDAGTYKVTVKFTNGDPSEAATVIYASESVVATVYSGLTTTIKGNLTEVVTYADFKAHVHNYVIQSDGEWKCSECSYVLDGTDEAYISVIQNAQPTEIIPLTSETTEPVEVGSNGATVTVSGNVVTYTNAGDSPVAQEVVIRTTSAETILTINAQNDTVRHYDHAGSLNIKAVAGNSYHENGTVHLIAIKQGHVKLEGGADVNGIHVYNDSTDTEKDTSFAEIKISVVQGVDVPKLSRSAVEIADEGTKVCTIVTDQAKDVYLFNEGIYEQIKTVDEGKNVATDESAAWANSNANTQNTQKAAQQLANEFNGTYDANGKIADQEITVETGDNEGEYKVKFNEDTREFETYKVEGNEEIQVTDAAVVEEVIASADVAADAGKTADQAVEEAVIEVIETVDKYVARIGSTGYVEFDDAFNAAKNNDTIVLLADIVKKPSSSVTKNVSSNLTIDLNAHSLTIGNYYGITVKSGAHFTVKNGTYSTQRPLATENNTQTKFENVKFIKAIGTSQGFQLYAKTDVSIDFVSCEVVSDFVTPSNNINNATLLGFSGGATSNLTVHFTDTRITWNQDVPFAVFSSSNAPGTLSFDGYSYNQLPSPNSIICSASSYRIKQTIASELLTFTVVKFEYWVDKVTTKPSAYVVEGDTISIGSAEALTWFAKQYDSYDNALEGKTVILTADIDMGAYLWKPIKCNFMGTFDGNGRTISNLTTLEGYQVTSSSTKYGNGLFHRVSGTVKNLTVANSTIGKSDGMGNNNINGVIAGYCNSGSFSNITVTNCLLFGFGKVGGIIGMQESGTTTITDCHVNNIIIDGDYNCAGFVGLAQGEIEISGCESSNVTFKEDVYSLSYIYHDVDEGDYVGRYWSKSAGDTYYAAWGDLYTDYDQETIGGITYIGKCH